MNPTNVASDSVTSMFTLALLKDTGFYVDIDLSYSESMQWGKDRGCDFLNGLCEHKFPEFVS